jgi:hypothetical protein
VSSPLQERSGTCCARALRSSRRAVALHQDGIQDAPGRMSCCPKSARSESRPGHLG